MIKNRIGKFLIALITVFVVLFAIYYSADIEGRVYTVSGQDTTYLEDVLVNIEVQTPSNTSESNRGFQGEKHSTKTDKTGYFLIKTTGILYRINCHYTFQKQGYDSKEIYRTFRISGSDFIAVRLNSSEGKHRVDIEGSDELFYINKGYDEHLNWFLVLLGAVAIPLFWIFFPFRWVVDQYRKVTNRGFKGLSKAKQEAFLKDGFCESCKDYMGMTYEREETKLGMTFMYGPCDSCGTIVKVRIK